MGESYKRTLRTDKFSKEEGKIIYAIPDESMGTRENRRGTFDSDYYFYTEITDGRFPLYLKTRLGGEGDGFGIASTFEEADKRLRDKLSEKVQQWRKIGWKVEDKLHKPLSFHKH